MGFLTGTGLANLSLLLSGVEKGLDRLEELRLCLLELQEMSRVRYFDQFLILARQLAQQLAISVASSERIGVTSNQQRRYCDPRSVKNRSRRVEVDISARRKAELTAEFR
jgi:hypothetical protein